MKEVTKAVIPVAGWGTRMLPITKSIEKCMLPIGTRPVVDFIVEDIIKAGVRDIYFVVSENSSQLESFYRPNIELNSYLERSGKEDKLTVVAPLKDVNMHFIVQPNDGRYGTSIPVGLANEFIEEGETALVVMGDQFFLRDDGGSNAGELIELVQSSGVTSGLLGVPVPWGEVSKYGIIEKDGSGNFVRIVEKPSVDDAPSNLNNASFYLFDKRMFELAKVSQPNPLRGEFEITDVINAYISEDRKIIVGNAEGQYLDSGTPEGWLHANNIAYESGDLA